MHHTPPSGGGPSPAAIPAEAAVLFHRLAQHLYRGEADADIYAAVTATAVKLVAGCDRACIMLLEKGKLITVGATDHIAWTIDQMEKAAGEGPCVDAIEEEAYQIDPDIATTSQWPKLAEMVLEQTPVRGMIGYRLLVDGRKAGALNLFSDAPHAFTSDSADQGAVIAAFASVALMTLSARLEARELREGLASNREIGKAVGLLMAAHKITADEAFGLLRKTSQDLNLKLTAVASLVVSGNDDQVRPSPR
ncbi:MAG: GAF and ANTAR domain-containing protein [Dermatophilaceae bacterium]|nr:GAF and ANTAR domain-containing protein [Actinomycetales bacterium]MBP8880217.1 GAF and ANTAR domain-containing protein [Dermatophilaceae bacterium]MBP9917502.1 GAF and ANTAR domain-containing protein [Dermatophilaceae bacterium]